jgi:hypothetical protein
MGKANLAKKMGAHTKELGEKYVLRRIFQVTDRAKTDAELLYLVDFLEKHTNMAKEAFWLALNLPQKKEVAGAMQLHTVQKGHVTSIALEQEKNYPSMYMMLTGQARARLNTWALKKKTDEIEKERIKENNRVKTQKELVKIAEDEKKEKELLEAEKAAGLTSETKKAKRVWGMAKNMYQGETQSEGGGKVQESSSMGNMMQNIMMANAREKGVVKSAVLGNLADKPLSYIAGATKNARRASMTTTNGKEVAGLKMKLKEEHLDPSSVLLNAGNVFGLIKFPEHHILDMLQEEMHRFNVKHSSEEAGDKEEHRTAAVLQGETHLKKSVPTRVHYLFLTLRGVFFLVHNSGHQEEGRRGA